MERRDTKTQGLFCPHNLKRGHRHFFQKINKRIRV